MDIKEIDHYLVARLGTKRLGQVNIWPKDIDYFLPRERYSSAKSFLLEHGFVLTSERAELGNGVFRRFEGGGNLYVVDIMGDFSVLLGRRSKLVIANSDYAFAECDVSFFKIVKQYASGHLKEHVFIELAMAQGIEAREKSFIEKGVDYISIPKIAVLNIRRLLKRGRSAAFVGPDGSGKTTMIKMLAGIGRTEVIYMGDWFFALQPLYNSVKEKLGSPWNRFLWFLYVIEHLFRSLKVLYYKKRGRIVLIDRFPGLNQHIDKAGILGFVNKLAFSFVPKPSLIFHLYAPSEIIFRRKQEIDISKIEAWNQALLKHLQGRSVVVDTTDLDTALNQVLARVYE